MKTQLQYIREGLRGYTAPHSIALHSTAKAQKRGLFTKHSVDKSLNCVVDIFTTDIDIDKWTDEWTDRQQIAQ